MIYDHIGLTLQRPNYQLLSKICMLCICMLCMWDFSRAETRLYRIRLYGFRRARAYNGVKSGGESHAQHRLATQRTHDAHLCLHAYSN